MKAIIIGSGFIASTHIEAIRRAGHEVSRLVGRESAGTKAFAQDNGIPHWTVSIEEALGSDAEMVHICTPPYNHAELIHKCLAAGKHIICEKPLCIDPVEAEALAEEARAAFERRGLVTALCCNVRYYPANLEAARRIRDSYTGGPVVIHGSYLQEFHIPPHPDGWRFDDALSGGQRAVSEIGTHWIDLAHAWTGLKITEVFADLRCWFPERYRNEGVLTLGPGGDRVKVSTEDTAAVLMRFENGGIGTLLLSETAPGHPNDLSLEFTDMQKSFKWEEASENILRSSEGGEMSTEILEKTERTDTFTELFRIVYAAAEGKKDAAHGNPDAATGTPDVATGSPDAAYPTFEEGAYISKVCSAIVKSKEQGGWIPIP